MSWLRIQVDELKRENEEWLRAWVVDQVLAIPTKVPLVMRRVFEFIYK